MNKIVIVGHPASGPEEVLALLQKCGMAAPLPSRREGMLPEAITATLCKAHKLPPLESVTDEGGFAQIEAAPVWQGMALDLMLGNLEQPLWGWADPQTIYALDYWEELDPQLTFVLVYDEPHRVLMEAARRHGSEGDAAAPGQELRRLLDNWVAYNGALLRFHLRHTGRSLLVHSQQVQRATDRYVEQLQPLLDTPLLSSAEAAALPGSQEGSLPGAIVPLAPDVGLALSAAGIDPGQAASLLQADRAEHYLIDDVLGHFPAVMQTYAELQSVANLPLDAPPREAEGVAAAAWEALLRQRGFVSQVMVRLSDEVRRAGDKIAWSTEKLRDAGEENGLLLTQLHKVQEELERQYLSLKDMERAKEGADKTLALLQEQARLSQEQASQEQAKKSEEQAKLSQEQAGRLRSTGDENQLLLGELHRANEELERYYLRLAETERGKANAERAFGDASRENQALKFQLQRVRAELHDWSTRPPDLSVVTSRDLLSTAVRRLIKRILPAPILRLLGRRHAGHGPSAADDLGQIRQSRWFNAEWYLETYQDVKQAELDAAEHYHAHGWKEGRRPGPEFDSVGYLTDYPDVREAGIDPLLHFIRHGANEGRRPGAGFARDP